MNDKISAQGRLHIKDGIRQRQSTNSSYFGTNIINFATGAPVAGEDKTHENTLNIERDYCWGGRAKIWAPSGKLNGNPCGGPWFRLGLPPLGPTADWDWKRLRFSGFPSRLRLSFGRPRPPVLSSSSGCGVVTGTSQSAVGGDTQRLRSLSKTSMAGHLWRRG